MSEKEEEEDPENEVSEERDLPSESHSCVNILEHNKQDKIRPGRDNLALILIEEIEADSETLEEEDHAISHSLKDTENE